MIQKSVWFLVFTTLFWSRVHGNSHQVLLSSNSPVTTGANVTLNATVVDSNGFCAKGHMAFRYEDDAFRRHTIDIKTESCEAIFNIPFETSIGPSTYRYKIDVSQQILGTIYYPIASGRGQLTVTENLNGQLLLFQNNINISKNPPQNTYVSSNVETIHKIELNTADYNYLNTSSNSTVVYWFVDCVYQANTTDYTFSSNYTQSDSQHEILGIVVANIKNTTNSTNIGPSPPPTIPTQITTTMVSPNSTTSITSSTPITTTTPTSNTTTAASTAVTNSTTSISTSATTAAPETNVNFSHHTITSNYTTECQQKKNIDLLVSTVQLENQQKYGYFSRSILVKDPITNIKTQGKVWIQEGEMLDLQVSCNASGPIRYCVQYRQGPYNVTGNETCSYDRSIIQCQMKFFHYFLIPTNYTLVVIMANDVSKVVTPIGINIYKVQKQPQISVIVVPVTFSSIAIIIVVFGIAYYFQNRSRYMVEVADFDFANNSDMEYKTFRERLRDAISQAINRTQDYSEYDGSEEQIGSSTTPQNQKYGSMQ